MIKKSLMIIQFDINNAFLYAYLTKRVFMEKAQGYVVLEKLPKFEYTIELLMFSSRSMGLVWNI